MNTLIFEAYKEGCGQTCVATIELLETQTFDDLECAIIERGYGWDDPHLYHFTFDKKGNMYDANPLFTYYKETPEDCPGLLTTLQLNHAKWRKGKRMLLVFDYGDDHRFIIKLKEYGCVVDSQKYPVVKTKGIAPTQYVEGEE